ncbi:hypothetical protein E2C01_060647 [Portunus trituberculatus]|uniref:Uncharacterized protein n=1 Tax=Portunus trituberculatus TaxID=210409 RepID=A0A5B7H9L1_PORTR|nr:hypothetical protein [Portunus trituberculatus]
MSHSFWTRIWSGIHQCTQTVATHSGSREGISDHHQ